MKLAILMATYNGERYLQEQIESLYAQTEKNWTLYVQDDGSTDATLSILEDNRRRHSNIVLLDSGQSGLGAKDNFLTMLKRTDADYYMFCDQDDVWLPQKIEVTLQRVRAIEDKNPKCPVVACTDLYVVNKNLEIIAPSLWKYEGIRPKYLNTFERLAVVNLATGCTMMLNRQAKEHTIYPAPKALMHDAWIIGCISAANGVIEAIETPLIYYRQHGANCVGAVSDQENTILKKLATLRDVWNLNRKRYKMYSAIRPLSAFTYIKNKIQYQLSK